VGPVQVFVWGLSKGLHVAYSGNYEYMGTIKVLVWSLFK
jgi:hypothetical protein